ncbi:MAG: MFS transporter [Polyangiales bacterium]
MAAPRTAPDHEETGWPKGIPYIIGNEGCERFSFYGMKAILFVFLTRLLLSEGASSQIAEKEATEILHLFNAAAYAMPLLGGILADRLLGKYPTILYLSLAYCVGHACLAVFEHDFTGFVVGLGFIALGAGGIKPCVSAHVGDQFGRSNWSKVERIYQAFYFIINFGSLFATLLIPAIKERYGFSYAFALPGVLMAIATFFFWSGRHVFVHVPPSPGGKLGLIDACSGALLFVSVALPLFGPKMIPAYAALPWSVKLVLSLALVAAGLAVFAGRQKRAQDDGFLAVLLYAMRVRLGAPEHPSPQVLPESLADLSPFWHPAVRKFGREAAEGPPAVLRILSIFAMVSVFWALFEQHSSSWIAQAREMDRRMDFFGVSFELLPEQIQSANPALVMLIVPLVGYALYPGVAKLGLAPTPLRRVTLGMVLTAASFAVVALAQRRIDAGEVVSVSWQLGAFVMLTLGEVLVSTTGLEFAYTQAPRRMKSLIMGFWYLAQSIGNLLVAALARFETLPRVQFFWLFGGLMLVTALFCGVRATFYRYKVYTQ